MRIAYVCSNRGVPVHGASGSSVHLRSVVRALAQEGAEVMVVAARRGEGDALPVEEVRGGEVASALTAGEGAARELGQALGALEVSRRLHRLHRERPFELVYERWSLWGTGGLEFARRHGVPFFLEVNAPLVDEALRHRGLKLPAAARAIEQLLLTAAERVFVVSRPLVASVVGSGASPDRVVLAPNGVATSLFERLARPQPSPEVLRVAFVGSLKPWHGVPVLLEAIRLARSGAAVQLLVAGDGPLRGEVEAAAAALGGDAIRWLGLVAHEEVPAILAGADVAVAPYAEREIYFSPLKVVEAMAAGTCVVVSRAGDLAELVRDGETGLLVPPGDAVALAQALLRLAGNRDLASRLGQAARAEVLRTRTWSHVARRVLGEWRAVREGVHAA